MHFIDSVYCVTRYRPQRHNDSIDARTTTEPCWCIKCTRDPNNPSTWLALVYPSTTRLDGWWCRHWMQNVVEHQQQEPPSMLNLRSEVSHSHHPLDDAFLLTLAYHRPILNSIILVTLLLCYCSWSTWIVFVAIYNANNCFPMDLRCTWRLVVGGLVRGINSFRFIKTN